MTADNVSPLNLIYIRKVGYGVRSGAQALKQLAGPVVTEKPTEAVTLEQMVRLLLEQELRQKTL